MFSRRLFPGLGGICQHPWLASVAALATVCCHAASVDQISFLSDHPELIVASAQDWGVLGLDVAAHAPDKEGSPLRISEKAFAKGLGHHANGTITVLVDGQYESFDAEIGIQPCPGGSVIFQVIVDGKLRFDSGVMRSGDAPKPVHVSLDSAQEVRLEARDAGDGIVCDMANWAEARLTRAATASIIRVAEAVVDMAQFARVVTWDPKRTDGASASRIEEFRSGDLFTETELSPDRSGYYSVPAWPEDMGCIGLQWLNRRALREVGLEFANEAQAPPTNSMRVEGWFGESAWQGTWKPLAGEWRQATNRLVFRLDPRKAVAQTQKIRWILPGASRLKPVQLSAFTRSRWATTNLWVQAEMERANSGAALSIWNGEFVVGSDGRERKSQISWDLGQPLRFTVRYSRPSSYKSDPSVLQIRLPTGSVGIAVEDVLSNDCVYLPDLGLFVAREPLPVTLADYKRRVANRRTTLQEVRTLPEQTLTQAMAKTHHDAQAEGPVMLSLACDNVKFIVERHGAVRFQATTNVAQDWFASAAVLRPEFGDETQAKLTRMLEGGWLPIPVITKERDGLICRQRSFVAPCDEAGANPIRLNRRSVCVAEFMVTNTLPASADVSLSLNLLLKDEPKRPATFVRCPRGWLARQDERPLALFETEPAAPLKLQTSPGLLSLSGPLPAHRATTLTVYLAAEAADLLTLPQADKLRGDTEAYWNAALAPATQIVTPDPLLNNVIRSSQVRCLIAARNEADGARIAPWIAAMSYGPLESEAHSVIRGMDFMGHSEFTRRSLDFFIHRYNTNGFLTTGYTTFGTAWHLWTLGEHFQLSHDQPWLRQVATELVRVGQWIVRQTEKTKKLDVHGQPVPEFGLIPPGVLADWNSFAYHFAMNAYYVAALRELSAALGEIGYPEAGFFERKASELQANTLRAYAWTQARAPAVGLRDGTWIPYYPSQVHSPGKLGDFFPGQDAGRSWCYDVELGAHQLIAAGVLDPHSREVERMMDHMEDVQFLADGWFDYPATMNQADWFNLGGFSKVQPYYTRNCEVYALRDDVKPFIRSYFNTLAAMLNPEVLTIWEHFHHSGAWDKTHETGYFLHQTRTMLIQERGEELWLAPFTPRDWLGDGRGLVIHNAPTQFGAVAYEIKSAVAAGYVEASVEPPTRHPPKRIVLRLRQPSGKQIQAVTVNGRSHQAFDSANETITLDPVPSRITLRAEF
jgi:NPCBM/NEW2 domain